MIRAIVLDIEGTTCPVNFVSQTLFPFAQKNMKAALMHRSGNTEIDALMHEAIDEWRADSDPTSQTMLRQTRQKPPSTAELEEYLQHLIRSDRKSTALKELQGIIWEKGYLSGELKSPLFSDVRPQLDAWKRNGISLSVYSSGSIQAQKLLYAHTNEGDITDRFCHWFDTRTGPKLTEQSYTVIAQKLGIQSNQVLFISDHPGECDAAQRSGMNTVFCLREGNPHQDPGDHAVVHQLCDIDLEKINAANDHQC
ncbi:Enolase-phosphatase E1 [Synechococcus sp. MIT S9509]|uniref:acireductone synthase n=1 Tax=unclassified Synechococcus TaxID=2626047 RepID=UPI0007BC72AE|nr:MULTISPECIES: acireductone synthase [unclassified Synechococcus]KZR83276.1 Enolase-phosphatase E1 [Synechococcus sp. MIT S9504]KZR88307.1 Enolase-phosphatase E1 [Synechococcus sp. MIT S9509]